MQTERIAVSHPVVPLQFAKTDFAASQTDAAIAVAGSTVTGYTALFDGWIVGIAVKLSAAITAGNLTVDATIGGTGRAIDMDIDTALTTGFWRKFAVGDHPFSAGSVLGASFTSDADLAPTTADAIITLYVMYDDAYFR